MRVADADSSALGSAYIQEATMTAEEFAKLDVELYSDHYRFELACGELAVREPVAPTHGSVLMNLARVLSPHVHKHRLGKLYGGDTSVFIDRNTVLGADVAFIQRDRLPLSDERWLLEPDLVIEVISPSNNPRYLAQKLRQYLSIGTRLVWYIDPRRRQIDVYRADGSRTVLLPGDTLSGEDVVEGFTCDVSEILDT
ncbi:MAG TPA: Uma2 family endonuclease [Gemmatimonadaceae bacterium]|nr:Uma2 family endonuclease [Gemmatimonadaceae bacterium]